MFLEASTDIYGRNENFTSSDFRAILDALDGYMKVPYIIREIRRDDLQDPEGRIDIEVEYVNADNRVIRQKLLILDGELLDGKAFHKRRKKERLIQKIVKNGCEEYGGNANCDGDCFARCADCRITITVGDLAERLIAVSEEGDA